MDPFTVAVAAGGLVSLAKDLVDLGRDVAEVYSTIRNAEKLLRDFVDHCNRLSELLLKINDKAREHDRFSLAQPALDGLTSSITKLRSKTSELKEASSKRRMTFKLSMPSSLKALKEIAKEISEMIPEANLALQWIDIELSLSSFNLLSLQQRKLDDLHSAQLQTLGLLEQMTRTALEQGHIETEAAANDECDHDMVRCEESRAPRLPARRTRRTKRFNISFKPWFVNKIFDFALVGDYRYASWHCRTQRLIKSQEPFVGAIRIGDLHIVEHYLSNGMVYVDDIIQDIEQSWPYSRLTADGVLVCQYMFVDSKKPFEMAKIMLKYLNVDQHIELLWHLLRMLTPFEQFAGGGWSIHRLLVEHYDLDLEMVWPTPEIFYHLDNDVDRGPRHHLLPIGYHAEIYKYLGARQRDFPARFRRHNEEILLQMSPFYHALQLPDLLCLLGINHDPDSIRQVSQDVKDWLLHSSLYEEARGELVGAPRLSRLVLQSGASFFSWFEQQALSPLKTISTAVLLKYGRGASAMMRKHLQQWIRDLAELGHDLVAYVEHERSLCPTAMCLPEYSSPDTTIELQDVQYQRADGNLQVWFNIEWQLSLWLQIPGAVPGSWPQHQCLPRYSLTPPSFTEEDIYPEYMAHDKPLPEFCTTVSDSRLARFFNYLPDHLVPGVQDDHGVVARSVLRSRHALKGHRRAHSQPRSLTGCRWRCPEKDSRRWLQNVHLCPFDTHGHLHWNSKLPWYLNSDSTFPVQLRNCLCNGIEQSYMFDLKLPTNKFEDHWLKKFWKKCKRRHPEVREGLLHGARSPYEPCWLKTWLNARGLLPRECNH